MKQFKLFIAAVTAALLFSVPVFANDFEAEQKSSVGVITQSLLSFSRYKAFTMSGESKNITSTTFLDETEYEEQSQLITGQFQLPDKMYMKTLTGSDVYEVLLNEDGYYVRIGEKAEWELIIEAKELGIGDLLNEPAIEDTELSTILNAQSVDVQSIIKNLEIINVYEENGVKFIDISAGDIEGLEQLITELKEVIAKSANSDASSDAFEEAIVQQITDDILNSMNVSISMFYRINVNEKKVDGIGYNLSIDADIKIMGFPVEFFTGVDSYIKIEETNKEIVFPKVK